MITVYKFTSFGRQPDLSQFVVKVETYLRMAGLPHRTAVGDPRTAPKGKLPYIDDGGTLVADSSLILDHLKSKYGDALEDGRLSPGERASARAWKSLFESDLYFVIVYNRWWRDEDFALYRPALQRFLGEAGVPALVRPIAIAIGPPRNEGAARPAGRRASRVRRGDGARMRTARGGVGLPLRQTLLPRGPSHLARRDGLRVPERNPLGAVRGGTQALRAESSQPRGVLRADARSVLARHARDVTLPARGVRYLR
jgi:hypothetical protein